VARASAFISRRGSGEGSFTTIMKIRVAIIGYGAVAAVHALGLSQERDVELVSVFGRKREKVSQFASTHGIPHLGETLEQAVALEIGRAHV
jgi:predicted dehydrogenase